MNIKLILIAATVVSTTVPAFAEGALVPLTGAELKEVMTGKTYRLVWTDGKVTAAGEQTMTVDGKAILKMDDGYTDAGTWSTKGDLVCTKFKKSTPSCDPIYKTSDGHLVWKGTGKKKGQKTTFTLKP